MNLSLGDTKLIIDECKRQGLLLNDVAYVLATAYHESAHTMKPIKEMGGLTYLKSKKYYPYFGRGYVQLTWDYNYVKAGKKLGVDFVKNPDLLLEPKYAAPILVTGMKEGWFTGKKLRDFIDTIDEPDAQDELEYEGGRKIINGVDKKQLIANYAIQYEKDLKAAGYTLDASHSPVQTIPETPAVLQPPLDHVPVQPPVASTGVSGLLGVILNILSLIFKRKS